MQVDSSEAEVFDRRTLGRRAKEGRPMYQEISLWTLICSATRMSDAPRSSGKTILHFPQR
jgi:hypothetical protein